MADERTKQLIVPCACTLVNLIYGAWQLVGKAAMSEGTSPFVFVFYRALGGTMVMFLALMFLPGSIGKVSTSSNPLAEVLPCLKRDGGRWLVMGFLMTANIGGGILAVSRVSAITCALFQPTVPIIAAGMSAFLGMENLTMWRIGAIILSVVGAIIVITQQEAVSADGTRSEMLGLLFLCMNVGGGASYMVFQKASGVLEEYSPTFVAGMSFLVASGVLFVAAIITTGLDGVGWRLGDHGLSLLALCYSVVLATAFNYSVLAWANKASTPTMVTSFQPLQPLFASLLSCIFFGVFLTPRQAIGGVLIIVGLLLNMRSENNSDDSDDMASKSFLPRKETSV